MLYCQRSAKEQVVLHNVNRLKVFMGFLRKDNTKWNGVKKSDLKLEQPWFPLKQQHLSEKSCISISSSGESGTAPAKFF